MSPRVSASAAAVTREGIVRASVAQASREGLEAVTIGRLAERLDMSKAGVIGPFGTKEELQLATFQSAVGLFRRDVWEPAAEVDPGLPRLEAICDAWLAHLTGDTFPGGCFLTQAAAEFDGRPGRVRTAVEDSSRLWEKVLAREAAIAIDQGDLPKETDPAQVAFELDAIAQGVNQALQLRSEADAAERGRRAMRRVLGLG
ncbi:MAG: TetR family transcriptional regulator [Thermoleophilia bacterium]|nr:TetR family transcriptional regulator [Thermoleophilia bacterium]